MHGTPGYIYIVPIHESTTCYLLRRWQCTARATSTSSAMWPLTSWGTCNDAQPGGIRSATGWGIKSGEIEKNQFLGNLMDLFTKNLWKTWDFLGNLMNLTLKIINPNYMWCSKNLGQPEDQKVDHNFAK